MSQVSRYFRQNGLVENDHKHSGLRQGLNIGQLFFRSIHITNIYKAIYKW